MKKILVIILVNLLAFESISQTGWKICTSPPFGNRVDDVFMVNTKVGYAVSGDGRIVKTTDGGENWLQLTQSPVYCRSVEFVNEQKGFVGAFTFTPNSPDILRRTTNGGASWTDLTPLLHPRARRGGICGLAVADSNTIYGGGNWYEDSAYIIKSTDGGNTWGFIDMSSYATSIIDFHFLNKDTGFVTGKGRGPIESAIILYTTNGGNSWSVKFENNIPSEYVWKIQRLTKQIWFASIEDLTAVPPRILKSVDGGMTWTVYQVATAPYNIEGIGFIDPKLGWTGGGNGNSFESKDGGKTWVPTPICPLMNRVFKVNDTLLFASGIRIWKYKGDGIYPAIPEKRFISMKIHPNPVRGTFTIEAAVDQPTHTLLLLLDESGRRVAVIDNANRPRGSYQFYVNTDKYSPGVYYVVLKTHEDKQVEKILIVR